MKLTFLFFFFTLNQMCSAQSKDTFSILFDPILESTQKEASEFKISKLKFYISNLTFFQNDTLINYSQQEYFLIDLEDSLSLNIEVSKPSTVFNSISFDIGIDSTTNVSGAMGGDLDPMHGMYWSWQSGYINFKLEGTSPKCPSRKNQFIYHIGGYQKPFYPLKTLTFYIKDTTDLGIIIDLPKLISMLELETNHNIMSPNKAAMDFADLLPLIFKTY